MLFHWLCFHLRSPGERHRQANPATERCKHPADTYTAPPAQNPSRQHRTLQSQRGEMALGHSLSLMVTLQLLDTKGEFLLGWEERRRKGRNWQSRSWRWGCEHIHNHAGRVVTQEILLQTRASSFCAALRTVFSNLQCISLINTPEVTKKPFCFWIELMG